MLCSYSTCLVCEERVCRWICPTHHSTNIARCSVNVKELPGVSQWQSTHVGHVRSKPDCLFWARPLWFVTFFRVSVETHKIARDVRVTGQPNGVIMKHSTRKSRLFEPIILPRQSETSSHCVKEGSADVSRSTWRPFCSKHGHVTRTSCDLLPAKS